MEILSIKIYTSFSNNIAEAKIKKGGVLGNCDIVYVGYNMTTYTFYTYENSIMSTKPLNTLEKNPFTKEEWAEITSLIRKKASKEEKVGPFPEENIYDDILLELQNTIALYQSENRDTFFTVDYVPGLYKATEIIENLRKENRNG